MEKVTFAICFFAILSECPLTPRNPRGKINNLELSRNRSATGEHIAVGAAWVDPA
jgi:hypothetical protein